VKRPDLDGLSARFGLPGDAATRFAALLDLVAGDPAAPTTVRDAGAAIDAHLADSLVALQIEGVREARTIADLGSGAGFPGLPLAVALPQATVFLVESTGRKCEFLDRAAAAAAAGNATVVCVRVEEWGQGAGVCDVVTARALAPLPVVCEYAAPLLADGGELVAWRGRRDAEEERNAAAAARELGLEPGPVERVVPFPAARDRHLHRYRKTGPTPERFPRRAGMAQKRPLGAAA
jgi:16S rRNA (guanine527-N7)-methyltransferase